MRTTVAKVLIGLLVVMSACSDDDDPDAAATTTTTPPSDPTTTTAIAVDLGDEPPFHDDGTSGSGCAPGDGAGLPDGWWYGTIGASITDPLAFDLACFLGGAAAEEAATSRGEEITNDYFVVNDNPALRDLALASNATATCIELGDETRSVDCAPADVAGDWAIWVRVVGGVVDRIVEQYAP